MSAAIDAKYEQLGGAGGVLGNAVSEEQDCPGTGLVNRLRYFEHGMIYSYEHWYDFGGGPEFRTAQCFAVHGPIYEKWKALRGEGIDYGMPSGEYCAELVNDSDITGEQYGYVPFSEGYVCAGDNCGVHGVHSRVLPKWREKLGLLGYPVTTTRPVADGTGRGSHFQGGSIYWHPSTGPFEVHGSIREKWTEMGAERSFMGYPITDELVYSTAGPAAVSHFQYASIYWSPQTGAHEIHGSIRDKWQQPGIVDALGLPTTDETATPDGVGRYNHFSYGSLYWHPNIGAYEVHGNIRARWAELGWERGWLGYPISDELRVHEAPQVVNLEIWRREHSLLPPMFETPESAEYRFRQWAIVKSPLTAAVSYFQNGSILCGGGQGIQEYRRGTEPHTREEFPYDPYVRPDRAWSLACILTGERIVYEERTFGINLGWSADALGNVIFERAGGATDPLRFGEPLAIRIKDQGYLCYGRRPNGINLVWSDEPRYEWQIWGGNRGELIDSTLPVSLYNDPPGDFVIYGTRDVGINLVHSRQPPDRWFVIVAEIFQKACMLGLQVA